MDMGFIWISVLLMSLWIVTVSLIVYTIAQ